MQYIYKWSISLDYKNRPVKFCWWQNYNRSWKNYWKPYFYTWNRKLSLYWMVQIKLIVNPEKFQAIVVKKC